LTDFWSGNAYFEKTQYSVNPSILLDEAAPFPNPGTPGTGPNTVYTYYRSHNAPHDGIGLAISNDGGATYSLYNNGVPVVNANSNSCGWDASNVIMPSVVKVGSTFFMVYEGASILTLSNYTSCSIYYLTFGDIGLATSTDGINWQKYNGAGLFLQHNSDQASFGCQNIGAPSVTYLSGQFYIFFHGDCGAASGAALITLCTNLNIAGLVCSHGLTACPLTYPNTATSCPYGFRFDGLRNKVGMVHAAGTDLAALHDILQSAFTPTQLPVMDIGVGAQSWDSRVNGRANVIQEGGYYYMFFEGSQYVFTTTYDSLPFIGGQGVSEGNWGWGIARTSDINNANINNGLWQKYQYNPIDQIFQNQGSGGGMQQPYVYYLNGAYRVYIWNTMQPNYNSAVLLFGTDPYLHVYPAINGGNGQCEKYHRLGYVDGDGWAQKTGVTNDYLCYGPYQKILNANDYSSLWNTWTPSTGGIPAGNYAVTFENMIDSLSCTGDFPPGVCAPIATLDITHNNGNYRDSIFVPYRNDYQFAYTYQDFEQQFSAVATDPTANSPIYEWRTFFDSHAYTRAHYVFLRQLDGKYDTTPPTASVNSPPNSAAPSFQVSWTGSDDRTGIWSFDVQYQDNGGAWNDWQLGTTSTSATFSLPAKCFHTYGFQVRARDNAGNTGGYPNSAQASTYVNCDFGVSASPGSSAIFPGGTAASTITLTSINGFSGAVTLTPSVSPTGPIASVSPTNPSVILGGTGTSTLTVTTTSGTSTGIYTVTIQGTSGPVSRSATFTLSVIDLTLSASPASIPADFTTTSTITAQLSDNAQGIIVSFSTNLGYFPSSTQGGSLTSCTTGSTGSCSVTIKSLQAGLATITAGATGYPTHQVTVSFFDFSVTVSPTSITALVGSTTTASLSFASLNGFSGTVTLSTSVTPDPTGMSCSVPASVTLGATTTATLSCNALKPGTYTVKISASSGLLSHPASVAYTIQGFTLSASPSSLTTVAGEAKPTTLTLSSLNGFTGSITLSASVSPSTAVWSCAFSPTSVTLGTTTTASISCSFRDAGSYTVTVTGTSGSAVATANVIYTVTDFSLSVSPASITLPAGRSGTVSLSLNSLNGYTGSATVSIWFNLPSCATASFTPSILTPPAGGTASSTISLTIGSACQGTSVYVYVQGIDSGGESHCTYFLLTTSEFQITLSTPTIGIDPGYPGTLTFTVTNVNSYPSSSLTFSTTGLPSLAVALFSPSPLSMGTNPTTYTETVSIGVSKHATPGTFIVTIAATDGSITRTGTFTLMIGYGAFAVTASPSTLNIWPGASGTETVTISPFYGPYNPLSLSASGLPSCITSYSFNPTTISPPNGGPSALSISTSSSCTYGSTYTVTVTATDGTISQSATFTLSLTCNPCGGGGGGSLAHGTLITMADGSKVSVQNLKVGDQMLGYNPITGRYTISTITSIKIVDASTMLVINTGTGTPLRVDASPTEILWTKLPDGTALWLPVTQLRVGDDLWTPNGWVPVISIASITGGHHIMYDITATDPYFANDYLDPPLPS
jgi:hypothetical protein